MSVMKVLLVQAVVLLAAVYFTSPAVALSISATEFDEIGLRDLILSGRGLTRQQQTVIYLHLRHCTRFTSAYSSSCSEWTNHTAVFFPRVDYLTRLEIPWSFGNYSRTGGVDAVRYPESVEIALSVLLANGSTVTTEWKKYVDDTRSYVVGSYTAFAHMDRGQHINMTWEEGCGECTCFGNQTDTNGQSINPDTTTEQVYLNDCSPQLCISNLCGVKIDDCTNTELCPNCNERTCDIKVYVGWVGTEGHGWPMNSYGSVPSAFTRFAISRSYRAAAGIVTKYDSILWVGN